MANTTGDTTYTVVKGDTFNAIAYANDMSVSDLKALNPGIDINRLMIGDVLNVKEQIPLLSVTTVDDVTYTEPIACPVEEVKDSSMYVGDSKILTPGYRGRGPGPRPGDLCERERDPAGDPVLHHPARAHHNSQGGGDQGEA